MHIITTRDVGLAIRDYIEGKTLYHFNENGEETTVSDCFETVDCSDASNLEIHTVDGTRFIVRIIAA